MEHSFHWLIGNIVDESKPAFRGCIVLKDSACGGSHQLPLFSPGQSGIARDIKYCNADMLLLKDDKIKVIIEIEESNVKPTHVCGKFLASALSTHYLYKPEDKKGKQMAESVLFLQILDSSKLKASRRTKEPQWDSIEKSIKSRLPIKGSKIAEYRLFHGRYPEFERGGDKADSIIKNLERFLNSGPKVNNAGEDNEDK